jgi:hypothetical protein
VLGCVNPKAQVKEVINCKADSRIESLSIKPRTITKFRKAP